MKSKINKDLLPLKAHYFLFGAGASPIIPYMPIFAKQLGFSAVVVGIINSILPIIGLLSKPFFGFISDKFQSHRTCFISAQGLTAIAFFSIMFIPNIVTTVDFYCHKDETILNVCPSNSDNCLNSKLQEIFKETNLTCQFKCATSNFISGISKIEPVGNCFHFHIEHDRAIYNDENLILQCPEKEIFKSKCEVKCNNPFVNEVLQDSSSIPNNEVTRLYQFWLFFICLIFTWASMAVVESMGDSICFGLLGEKHLLYGNQRVWGSVGYGLTSLLAGVLIDAVSGQSVIKNYSIIFWMTLIIIGSDMFVSKRLPPSRSQTSSNIIKDIYKMFLSPRITVFFIWCICVGLCTALVWNFLLWHLEDLGNNMQGCDNSIKTLQGLTLATQCFGGELPLMFLSGWIIEKLGYVNVMSLVLGAFALRFLLYSFLVNPWYVLPIELLNGLTFAIFYSTMVSYASIIAPAGAEATMQGLVGAVFQGVGVSIGSFIGGLLFVSLGGSETFRFYGIFALVACLVHILIQLVIQKYFKDRTENLSNGNSQIELKNEEKKIESKKDFS